MHIGLVSRLSVPMPMSIRMPTNKCMRGMSVQVRHLKRLKYKVVLKGFTKACSFLAFISV